MNAGKPHPNRLPGALGAGTSGMFGCFHIALLLLAVSFCSPAATCLPPPTGIVSWWPGDGDASDVTGTNNGTLQGGATASAPAVVGSAFSFDGTNGYVQVPDSALLHLTNLTVEAWVRFSSLDSAGSGGSPAGEQYIVFKQNTRSSSFEGFDLGKERVGSSDFFTFIVSSASGQTAEILSSTVVTTGVWYHVAGVRGSNFIQLHVNGQLERQTNVSFTQDYGGFPLFFGTSGQSYWDHKFKGMLDEVSLYNRALSSNEIAGIYAAGAAGKCAVPRILAQPQSQSVMPGSNATFTVTASGSSPLSYQWQFNGAILGGATSTNLTLTDVQATNAGNYTVVVTNVAGAITSSVAMLTVLTPSPPSITNQPLSQTAWPGAAVTFNAGVTGTTPLTFQWQKNGTNLSDGTAISGASTSAVTVHTVTTNDVGDYRIVVTNYLGAATSLVAVLTVNTGALMGADALVLVNSGSAKYPDFQHFIQPYLDNFGVPYTVQDIATNPATANLGRYALILIGHKQFDTNHTSLDDTAQANISLAVSNGTGLVNFDCDLSIGSTPRYQFVQDVFGFTYAASTTGTNASFPPTEPSQMHYITALHPTNESFVLTNSMSLANLTLPQGATAVALSSGHPFVVVKKYGQGRAVQWASYDWISVLVQGPINGLDDIVWRGLVWAARKPFVIRGLPNFVTMRVDDVSGPFTWVHTASETGFKPLLALFYSNVTDVAASDLRSLVTNGSATATIHSITDNGFFYFDHQNQTSFSDSVISNHYAAGTQWHLNHGIPIGKSVIAHWSEIGPNAFTGLKNWGVEFMLIEIIPGQLEYQSPPAPWLIAGPYRLYETPLLGESLYPFYYADFLTIPGHPELDGQFFDAYTEIKNMNPATANQSQDGDWGPTADVASSILHGTLQLKRALDSMVLATVFTHEVFISPIPNSTWRSILQGITNNLTPYKPLYVTMDYANQYVRATRTSLISSSQYETSSGHVLISLSGKADLDTSLQVFLGNDNSISNLVGAVPSFTNSITITTATVVLPPVILTQPQSRTNHAGTPAQFTVLASGTDPSFQWRKNSAPISQATNSTLTLPAVTTNDAALYSVLLSNAAGTLLSSNAGLTIASPLLIQAISVTNGTAAITWSAIPGNSYTLQRKDQLTDSNWNDLLPAVQAVSNSATTSNPINSSAQRFYRVLLGP